MACLVAGSINIDEFYSLPHIVRPGETISSTHYERRAGGKGGNQAVAAARAGGHVALEAAIGGNADGRELLLPLLQDAGVDVARVEAIEGEHTGRAIIQRSADGENSIVLFPGANQHRFPSPTACSDATHLVVQNEIPFDATLAYLARARERAMTTVFNPSPMPAAAQLRAFPWAAVDWLLLNEGEAGDIAGAFEAEPAAPGTAGPGEQPTGDLPAEARAALAVLARLRGLPEFATVNFVMYRPAAPLRNPIKDTTGAGDTFTGYFVAGLMRGDGLSQIVSECLAACSMCVENHGAAESVPMRKAVLERL